MRAGSLWAGVNAGTLFSSQEDKDRKRKQVMSEEAHYLAHEIGKLKGSIVKIGQMMALYGEHFLPDEVTEALHSLNNDTMALSWSAIEQQLKVELGDKLNDLVVDHAPLGTASLAQVHRAVRKSDGLEVVLKVQYPGVAAAIGVHSPGSGVGAVAYSGGAGVVQQDGCVCFTRGGLAH